MAVNDIYQVSVFQDMVNVPDILNVFYYAAANEGSNAEDLLSAFADDLWDVVRAMQVPGCVTVKYKVVNTHNNSDWKEQDVSDAGLNVATNPVPPQVAAAFRAPRTTLGSRYSYKRFAGIPSAYIDTGDGSWNSTMHGIAHDTCIALGILLEGDDSAYAPIQVTGGFHIGVPAVPVQQLVGNWSFNTFPSHQDTRQVYQWGFPPAP